jgi:hypothetical protein
MRAQLTVDTIIMGVASTNVQQKIKNAKCRAQNGAGKVSVYDTIMVKDVWAFIAEIG